MGQDYGQMLTVTTSDLQDVVYSLYLSKCILHEHPSYFLFRHKIKTIKVLLFKMVQFLF